jgi:cation:H+ antiporter
MYNAINILIFIVSLAILIKGADTITRYASRLAKLWGVSELVIGITIVAISTSLPELAVSLISVLGATGGIAVGTIIGSNIANIGLIVGISALASPLLIKRRFIKEGVVMIFFSIVTVALLLDGMFWYEGIVLIIMLLGYLYYLVKSVRPESGHERESKSEREKNHRLAIKCLLFCAVGAVFIAIGAEVLVYSTVNMAQWLGISETVIALIAIAIGTSLPEFATSVVAALKRMRGISVGNIIGSNIFNVSILGLVSLFGPVPTEAIINNINIPIMLALSFLLVLFMRKGMKIDRTEAVVLFGIYLLFLVLQFIY